MEKIFDENIHLKDVLHHYYHTGNLRETSDFYASLVSEDEGLSLEEEKDLSDIILAEVIEEFKYVYD